MCFFLHSRITIEYHSRPNIYIFAVFHYLFPRHVFDLWFSCIGPGGGGGGKCLIIIIIW
jgi:hypothetical protein